MIVQNEVTCNKCGDRVFSAHRHDFKRCKCGAIAVDGGLDYLRRVGDISDYTDTSMHMSNDDVVACVKAVEWADDTGRNEWGTALAVIRALRDAGLLNLDKFKE